jgi:hypothetical protein
MCAEFTSSNCKNGKASQINEAILRFVNLNINNPEMTNKNKFGSLDNANRVLKSAVFKKVLSKIDAGI